MITVCMATYNGGKYIREQAVSILGQLSCGDELVVSDDGSSDDTIEILEDLEDPRIRILRNDGRHGIVGNFENALRNARGEYIFLTDQDDLWLPGKVERCMEALGGHDLVVHDATITDGELSPIAGSFFELHGSGKGFWNNLRRNCYMGSCMAFRASVLEYTLPFPPNIAMHDMWIGLRCERKGSVEFIPEPLILYRRHGGNASATGEKSGFSIWRQLKYRMIMLKNVKKK